MVIVALYGGCRLLEADVVEPGKGSTADVFDCVVWNQELFLHADGKVSNSTLLAALEPPVSPQTALRLHHHMV